MSGLIGSTYYFGDYQWIVIDDQGDEVLLLSKYIIDQGSFHNEYLPITWEQSSIRKYLNSTFLETFEDKESDLK